MVKVFEQGDIIWLNFTPQAGHEQMGHRPAIVISRTMFNRTNSMTMVCPITHTNRNSPLHVKLDGRTKTDGYILCDQCRMMDITARNAEFIEQAPDDLLAEVIDIIIGIIEL
jgi:mRNA interferase MazF